MAGCGITLRAITVIDACPASLRNTQRSFFRYTILSEGSNRRAKDRVRSENSIASLDVLTLLHGRGSPTRVIDTNDRYKNGKEGEKVHRQTIARDVDSDE
jgi:hypothetical protein